MSDKVSRLDYCQYLLVSQINDTLTNFADHSERSTRDLMLYLESLHKIYYCPLKDNRQVDDSQGTRVYRRVDALAWSEAEFEHGKRIQDQGVPQRPSGAMLPGRGLNPPHGRAS